MKGILSLVRSTNSQANQASKHRKAAQKFWAKQDWRNAIPEYLAVCELLEGLEQYRDERAKCHELAASCYLLIKDGENADIQIEKAIPLFTKDYSREAVRRLYWHRRDWVLRTGELWMRLDYRVAE